MNTTERIFADEAIKAKAAEIEKELAAWADANQVVGAGQRLVFHLRLEKVTPIVVCVDAGDLTTRKRRKEDITAREVYDATLRVMSRLKPNQSLNMYRVEEELNAPGVAQHFYNADKHSLNRAYKAAKMGKPFPEGEDE